MEAGALPVVGDERLLLALDDFNGELFVKNYLLRGIGEHIEVWVANDTDDVSTNLEFPAGDCRNDGVRTVITDAQVNYLIGEFDDNIYPLEPDAFSVAPARDGTNALLDEILELPADYYEGEATTSSS